LPAESVGIATADTVGEAVVSGVRVRRPGMEGADAVRLVVVVPVAEEQPPERTSALETVVSSSSSSSSSSARTTLHRPELSIELIEGGISMLGK
jgi:hypothetical protein